MLTKLFTKQIAIPLIIAALSLFFFLGFKLSDFLCEKELSKKDILISELREKNSLQENEMLKYKQSLTETILIQNQRVEREREIAREKNKENEGKIKDLENRDMTVINKVDCSPINEMIIEDLGL